MLVTLGVAQCSCLAGYCLKALNLSCRMSRRNVHGKGLEEKVRNGQMICPDAEGRLGLE